MDAEDITHTPEDNPGIVNYNRTYEIASAIYAITENLSK
jgi:hypothetical protein